METNVVAAANEQTAIPKESAISTALSEIDAHIENVKLCVRWLIGNAIPVLSVDMRRGRARPRITVAPSPRLYIILRGDCANYGRRCLGENINKFLWIAQRYGCDILWEEARCA